MTYRNDQDAQFEANAGLKEDLERAEENNDRLEAEVAAERAERKRLQALLGVRERAPEPVAASHTPDPDVVVREPGFEVVGVVLTLSVIAAFVMFVIALAVH